MKGDSLSVSLCEGRDNERGYILKELKAKLSSCG